jgi:hypothetical protein
MTVSDNFVSPKSYQDFHYWIKQIQIKKWMLTSSMMRRALYNKNGKKEKKN